MVDAASRRVRLGDRAWPFALDLRDGTAELDLGGRLVRLRPLRWGEKVRLARFARAGGDVLAEQLLLLAAPDGGDPGRDGAERDALLALALWLNAPAAEPELPLEPGLLAAVTLEVCRATGLAPADLDGREAPEVEALWRVASAARPPAGAPRLAAFGDEAVLPATTRILVVPDSPAAAAAGGERAAAAAAAAAEPAPGATAGAGSTPPGAGSVLPPREEPPRRAATAPPPAPPAWPAPPPEEPPPRSRRSVDRFRVVPPAPASALSTPGAAEPVGAAAAAGGGSLPPEPESALLASVAAVRRAEAHAGGGAEAAAPIPRGGEFPIPAPPATGLDPGAQESLLQELGRRLEQAAAELGIDTEPR